MSAQRATVINVPQALRAKVGGMPALDATAIAKAEEALKALSANFDQWLNDEIEKLEHARGAVHAHGLTMATAEALYFRAHDLKGLGATYEFPLVTKLAGSLCKLLDNVERRLEAPMMLVDAHIDAIRAVVRDGIRDPSHPIGQALTNELQKQVKHHLGE
jgi:hypothetical protein